MGHNAFVDRSNRPNYKLHVIIFLAITGVSVFLSTQVEKSRDKANIAALKNPVPIDSIAHDGNTISQDTKPAIKPPVIATSSISSDPLGVTASLEGNQEYSFDNAPNLENVDALPVENVSSTSEAEVLVMNSSLAVDKVTDMSAQEVETNAEKNRNIDQTASPLSLDQAFQQQNDRFLQTLAKTAEVKAEESAEIKRLRDAMRSDKPLPIEKIRTVTDLSVADAPDAGDMKKGHVNEITKADQIAIGKTQDGNVQTARAQHVNQQIAISGTPVTVESDSYSQRPETTIVMTQGELNNVVNQFANSYNEGDINRLMALFAENAVTNDQQSKTGIKADYTELFSNTKTRKLMINDVKWQFGMDKAEGAAEFVVVVQPINGAAENSYHGQIKITAIKQPRGVYITRLLHELKQ